MGACATKPKVLTEGAAQAPEAPKEEEEQVVVASGADPEEVVEEEKKVVEIEVGEAAEFIKESVGDDKADDDQSSKRRSLSHLFKENVEGKETAAEGDGAPTTEPVKQESSDAEKPEEKLIEEATEVEQSSAEPKNLKQPQSQEPVEALKQEMAENLADTSKQEAIEKPAKVPVETKLPAAEESELPAESTPIVAAPEKGETERVEEASSAPETKLNETPEDKTPNLDETSNVIAVVDAPVNVEKGEAATPAPVTITNETPDDKNPKETK